MAIAFNVSQWKLMLKAHLSAHRNRWKHFDLAMKYRKTADEEERLLIGQEMMMRDREAYLKRSSDSTMRYPILSDYYIPPGKIGWSTVRYQSSDREAGERELRQRLRPGRR